MSGVPLVATLGGIGLFLIGMRMMSDGLRLAAGERLRTILAHSTKTRLRALAAGFAITAIAQSSSVVTIATLGFVNAGLLGLGQAVFVVFGANVGTTATSWLVSLVGIGIRMDVLALPLVGVGALLELALPNARRRAIGRALAGFGLFFLGVSVLKDAFAGIAAAVDLGAFQDGGVLGILLFVAIGIGLTVLTQSSSASIAMAITAAAGGLIGLEAAAATVIGANLGTTSTALLASIGATADAKRVALAHVLFNAVVGIVALALLPALIALVTFAVPDTMEAGAAGIATTIALFHSLTKVIGVLVIWPLAGRLVAFLAGRFVSPDESAGRARHLDPNMLAVPSLAMEGVAREVARLVGVASETGLAAVRHGHSALGALASRRRTVERLSGEIRAFLRELQKQTLPEQAVDGIGHALRAVRHAEEMAARSLALAETSPPRAESGGVASRLATFSALVERALARLADASPEGVDTAAAETLGREVEAGYQALKAEILAAGAAGSVPFEAVDGALDRAYALRRLAEHAAKARIRLARVAPPPPESGFGA